MIGRMQRLAVIIPALNAASSLPGTLAQVAAAQTLAVEVMVVDGGSGDGTQAVARACGASVLSASRGRGSQMAAGDAPWLFFLHADTRLGESWEAMIAAFLSDPANQGKAGVFRLRFDDAARAARCLEWIADKRSRWLGLPYGDQGLLISRAFYESVGGFAPIPIMEDVALVRRIGRRNLVTFPADAITDARRYRRMGYGPRMLRNLVCLTAYFLGVPPRWLVRLYG